MVMRITKVSFGGGDKERKRKESKWLVMMVVGCVRRLKQIYVKRGLNILDGLGWLLFNRHRTGGMGWIARRKHWGYVETVEEIM